MLKIGDRVKVKARADGPDVAASLASRRVWLWGEEGTVVDIIPQLDRPVVVALEALDLPGLVRFCAKDLRAIPKEV